MLLLNIGCSLVASHHTTNLLGNAQGRPERSDVDLESRQNMLQNTLILRVLHAEQALLGPILTIPWLLRVIVKGDRLLEVYYWLISIL